MASDPSDDQAAKPLNQPSALPPPPRDLQDELAELQAQLKGVKSLNELVPADKHRRYVGYVFYFFGAATPLWSIGHLTCLGSWLVRHADEANPPPDMAALWIFYALPVAASLLTGAAFFAIGNRLHMSTQAVEQMEHLKAGDSSGKKGNTTLQVELPKAFKLGSSDSD